MNDKELADRVVALGVGSVLDDGITYLLVSDDGGYAFNPVTTFVRDWRVAGALMEKMDPVDLQQYFTHTYMLKIKPRAIIEACFAKYSGLRVKGVEALSE